MSRGHPDKLSDQISDKILDGYIAKDPKSRVAIETLINGRNVVVSGEISSKANIEIKPLVKQVLTDAGYANPKWGLDLDTIDIIEMIQKQSKDICLGVTNNDITQMGAGDQGIVFGYTCDESPNFMPITYELARQLITKLDTYRRKKYINELGPDAKAQVTLEFVNDRPHKITDVILSSQHCETLAIDEVRSILKEMILNVLPKHLIDSSTRFMINPTGRFVSGGPAADCGLTGRKIIIDSYGGFTTWWGRIFR